MPGVEGNERLMFDAMTIFQDPKFLAERAATCGSDRPRLWDARAATFHAMDTLGMFDAEPRRGSLTPEEAHAMDFISKKVLELTNTGE